MQTVRRRIKPVTNSHYLQHLPWQTQEFIVTDMIGEPSNRVIHKAVEKFLARVTFLQTFCTLHSRIGCAGTQALKYVSYF